eukprot:13673290-Heterocapsa_arctica.AAC.1
MAAGVIYMLMAMIPRNHFIWSRLPKNLQDSYAWLPFWYAFLVSKFTGSVLEYARDSVLGVGIAC